MPIKDPDKRRQANRERMRIVRAEGRAVEDPILAVQRKRRWYEVNKDDVLKKKRERRQAMRQQDLISFTQKISER